MAFGILQGLSPLADLERSKRDVGTSHTNMLELLTVSVNKIISSKAHFPGLLGISLFFVLGDTVSFGTFQGTLRL